MIINKMLNTTLKLNIFTIQKRHLKGEKDLK